MLDFIVPPALTSQMGEIFNTTLLNQPMMTFLDPDNLTLIDYAIIGQPTITQELLQISLKGDIRSITMEHCSLKPPVFKEPKEEDFQVYVTPTLLQCAVNAFSTSGVLNDVVQGYLQTYLPLDNKIKLEFNISSLSTANISSTGTIDIFLDIEAIVIRNFGIVENFLTLNTDFKTSLQIELTNNGGFELTAKIPQASADLSVSQVASDMPQFYKQQIKTTNFTEVNEMINSKINAQIPTINQEIAEKINATLFNALNELSFLSAVLGLNPIQLNFTEKYIYFGVNVTAL